jgi:hypothetical protein
MEEEEDVEDHDIPFSLNVDTFGDIKEFELIEGGSSIQVTNENKKEFILLCAKHRLVGGTEKYLKALKNGFNNLIPEYLIKDFSPEEVEMIICGKAMIDIEDWKKNTRYSNGFNKDSEEVYL